MRGGEVAPRARAIDLDRDQPVQLLVERLHDGPEAPLAEDLKHFVMPDAAERAGLVGRLEEVERGFVLFLFGEGHPLARRIEPLGVRKLPVTDSPESLGWVADRTRTVLWCDLREHQPLQESTGALMGLQEGLDPLPQRFVPAQASSR